MCLDLSSHVWENEFVFARIDEKRWLVSKLELREFLSDGSLSYKRQVKFCFVLKLSVELLRVYAINTLS